MRKPSTHRKTRGRFGVKILVGAALILCAGLAALFLTDALNNQREGGEQAEQNARDLLSSAQLDAANALALQNVGDFPIIAKLSVETLKLELPVIGETTPEALEASICLFSGPSSPEDEGNMVITGHNYKNGSHFGKLRQLKIGDAVTIMDKWGVEYAYEVYEIVTILPDRIDEVNEYEGDSALTLLTCTSSGNKRLMVRCKRAEA